MNLKSITDKFGGRHTTAIFAFFVSGTTFHYFHRLDDTFIHFMTILMGYVLAHSAKEDASQYFNGKNDANNTPDAH